MRDEFKVSQKYLEEAYAIHQEYAVADAHFDLPAEIMVRKERGETSVIRKYYLEQWKQIGMNLVIASVFLYDRQVEEDALRITMEQIAGLMTELEACDDLLLIRNTQDLRTIREKRKIGIVLYLEGLDCLHGDENLLRLFYEMGVRGAALTWSRQNELASGSGRVGYVNSRKGMITTKGFRVIKEMTRLGMFLDISHLNDDGTKEILLYENLSPILATHSNLRWVEEHSRNLTRDQMLQLKKRGGIIGINANRYLIGGGMEKMLFHIRQALDVMGSERVCLGLDLCDGYGSGAPEDILEDYTDLMKLTAGMLEAGFKKEEVTGVIGRNLIHFMEGALKEKEADVD